MYPNEVLLSAVVSGLEIESIVPAHQIRTISRKRINRVALRLESAELQKACREAVRVHLGMY